VAVNVPALLVAVAVIPYLIHDAKGRR